MARALKIFLFIIILSLSTSTVSQGGIKDSPLLAQLETMTGEGLGFVVSDDGIIVTNYSLLDGSSWVKVTIGDRTWDDAYVLAVNREWDLAAIKISARGLGWFSLASEPPLPEEPLFLVDGQGKKQVSYGTTNAPRHAFRLTGYHEPMLGGPVLNSMGEVVGVTSKLFSGNDLIAISGAVVKDMLAEKGSGALFAWIFGDMAKGPLSNPPGELGFQLEWDGDAQLELEVWDQDFNYLGTADFVDNRFRGTKGLFALGAKSPPGLDLGRHIIAVSYKAGSAPTVDTQLTLTLPDGSKRELTGRVTSWDPYRRWFAVLADTEAKQAKVMDFYTQGDLFGVLEWDGKADVRFSIEGHQPDAGGLNNDHGIRAICFGLLDNLQGETVLVNIESDFPQEVTLTFYSKKQGIMRFSGVPGPQAPWAFTIQDGVVKEGLTGRLDN